MSDERLQELRDHLTTVEKLAIEIAKDAYENDFGSRRVVGRFEDQPDFLYLYDNSPHAERAAQLEALKAAIGERWVEVIATGTYPADGDEAGYTIALVLDVSECDADAAETIKNEWRKLLREPEAGIRGGHLRLIKGGRADA